MAGNTAEKVEFTPVWGDLDEQFNDPENYELEDIFDEMVSRQSEVSGEDLKTPCPEAQDLIDQWTVDDDQHDYMQHWRGAVARRAPGVDAVPDNRLNDAVIRGRETDGLTDFLARNATFLLGQMYGQRDRRNTQDEDWNSVTLSWADWIGGQPGNKNAEGFEDTPKGCSTGKARNAAAWGFSRHPVGKDKAGACVVLGSSVGGARKAKAMTEMYAMGLDVDSGASLDETLDRVEELGLLCFAYTTFSHGKTGLELKRDEVLRKLSITRDPTDEEIRTFLRKHDKHRYEEDFIAECTIKAQKEQTTEGVKIVLDTPPLDKFRLIFPLAEPVKLIDLADTQAESLSIWEDKITGLARNTLGVHYDTSCSDPSRLFYTARHPRDAKDWYAAIIMGNPLVFDDITPMRKAAYTGGKDQNAFTMAGGGDEDRPTQCYAPSGMGLNDWHFQNNGAKDRFLIAGLLETLCSDKIRTAGGEAQGHVHTECPFEGEHSSEGGTATMAINAGDGHNEWWTWFCHHDACQGRHKLEFLEEALRQGWFEEDSLYDLDQGFLLSVGDDEVDPFEAQEVKERRAATFEERAAEFDEKAPWSDIENFCGRIYKEGADKTVQMNVTAIIAKNTNHTRPDLKKIWKGLERSENRKGKGKRAPGIYLDEGSFRERCDRCEAIMTDQGETPSMFHSNGRIAEIGTDEHGELRIENIDPNRFKARIEDRMDFYGEKGSVEAPKGIVNNVYHRDKTEYPSLHRIIRAPTYAPDKSLITEPGYHPSGVIYQPQVGVVVPRVSAHPTKAEVRAAVDKLVDPFADFRFDAMTREELVSAVKEGRPVPSLCHALSVALTPLCRAFIDGPTPGHLARKMKPRTGATKLLSAVSYIATLSYARPQSLPDNKAEVQKTIVSCLDSGQPFTFFDNLPDSGKVDFGELASAMTAWPYYTGRRLGVTGMVDATNDTTWLFTGNRTALSEELAYRVLLIVLDPQTEHPEDRTDFKYDIDSHVVAHGGEYLHCLLTIVQHWVSEGCKEWSGRPLGGFERHSAIIGGILESAGIMGFLDNREVLRSTSAASTEDELMDALIEMHHATPERKGGTLFRVWGADAPPQHEGRGTDRKPHQYAGYRVVSIKDTLEAESIALRGTGYAQTEDGGVIYPSKSKSALRLRIANMVGSVRELGPDREEEEKKHGRYIFEKVFSDQHSALYRLKHLP